MPLNNRTTSDDYSDACTLREPGAVRWNIDVANAAVYYRFGDSGAGGGVLWSAEVFMGPGFRSFDRIADAVQLRSGAAGHAAQVTVEAVPSGRIPNTAPAPGLA